MAVGMISEPHAGSHQKAKVFVEVANLAHGKGSAREGSAAREHRSGVLLGVVRPVAEVSGVHLASRIEPLERRTFEAKGSGSG